MIIGSRHDTAETIVTILAKGPCDTLELEKLVAKERVVTTQGFYKALRKLVKDEVVSKNKQRVFLNNAWVTRMHEFISTVDGAYASETSRSLVSLAEGESLTYSFRNIESVDTLWMHYFFLITKECSSEPVLMYDAHEFWSLVRPKAQSFMYEWMKNNGRTAYIVIGSNTDLDRKTTVHIKKLGFPVMYESKASYRNNYFTLVIGDYVMDTIIDKGIADAIHRAYRSTTSWNESARKNLHDIIRADARHKVVITRSPSRARKISKPLMNYFLFAKKTR